MPDLLNSLFSSVDKYDYDITKKGFIRKRKDSKSGLKQNELSKGNHRESAKIMGGSAISKEKRNPPQSKIMPKYVKLSAKHPNDSTPKVPRGITIEQIKKDYDRYREHWRRSKCRQDLLDILCQILATRHFKITNCVCIGLGSFTNGVYTSMWQLAMIQTVLNLLRNGNSTKMWECPS
ncbi:MAG: hypothetical protein LQ351_000599 [Letrouitia transgressa]|nr:MAG: hypothetical protein LQ351_000599 [Letrouitia transgressa]